MLYNAKFKNTEKHITKFMKLLIIINLLKQIISPETIYRYLSLKQFIFVVMCNELKVNSMSFTRKMFVRKVFYTYNQLLILLMYGVILYFIHFFPYNNNGRV